MAITRPVTKTVISIPNWGVPITDQVNTNTTDLATIKSQLSAFQTLVTAGAGGHHTNGVTLLTLTIPAHPLARKFRFDYAVLGMSISQSNDLQVLFNGSYFIAYRLSGQAMEMVSLSYDGGDIAANQAATFSIKFSGAGSVDTVGDGAFNRFSVSTRPVIT